MTRLATVLCLITIAGAPARAVTPNDVEAAVPFASRGLGAVVRFLASDRLKGRDNDTLESLKARKKLAKSLKRIGEPIHPELEGLERFSQHFTSGPNVGTNLVSVMRGTDLADEYVVVGAHYDHLDTRSGATGACSTGRAPGGEVCNGATDNAAGVSIVLAVGRALRRLPTPPRRSVVFALWDAEEDGLLGSLHYVNNPPVPIAQTRAYVNFDIQGSDLLPSLAATSFAVGAETGGSVLADLVAAAVQTEGLQTLPVSYIFGQLRSDYASFVAKNVPTVFFSDSTNGCYHTIHDDLNVVDWTKLETQSRIGFRTVVALAEATTPPTFVPPNPALATYADALSLRQVFATAQVDLPLFAPADQGVITATGAAIEQIVHDGAGAFDQADVATLLTAALDGVAAIQRLGCRTP
jgi:Zn-dependent M28 family amino/carboxypeptidase